MSLYRPAIPKKLRNLPFKRQRKGQTGQLDHRILDITMEARLIQLVGPVMVDRQMDVLVMSYQGMNKQLGRNAEREQHQQTSSQYAF